MSQEISSLMDGELEPGEAERAIRSCCASDESARKWNEYHVIGEAIRGHAPRPSRVAERVMAALGSEPTVLAPRPVRRQSMVRVALAAAASVVTMAAVGWIGFQGGPDVPAVPAVAQNAPAAPAPLIISATPAEISDYLAAHRQIPAPDHYRTVASQAPVQPR